MPSDNRSSALEKALSVLEAVSDQPQAVGLPDLAARLGLPRQTVHRVLGQLETLRLIIRDRSRERYSVGPRLSKLAFVTLRSLNQSAPVRLILQDLVDDIGESCNVGVLDDLDYVFLQLIECEWPLRLHQEVGTRIAAHTVSGGKLLLAYLDPALEPAACVKARKLKAATSHTLTSVAELEAEFARIRAAGYRPEQPGALRRHRRRCRAGLRPRRQCAGRRRHARSPAAPHHQGLRAPRARACSRPPSGSPACG